MLKLLPLPLVLLATSFVSAQTFTQLYEFGSQVGDPTNPTYSGVISQSRGGDMFSSTDDSRSDQNAPFVTYLPVCGRAGAVVQILGQGFTSDSVISFNGRPARVKLLYPTFIKATVPDGALKDRSPSPPPLAYSPAIRYSSSTKSGKPDGLALHFWWLC